jgi:hypothetical protein
VATPEKFNGHSKDLKNFIASVENAMLLQPSRFPSDHIKILYIGTLLTGDALTWFRTLAATPGATPSSISEFWTLLSANFGDPCAEWTARSKLKALRQGKQSCVTYTTKFKQLGLESGYNTLALLQLYHDGLNDSIKDALAQTASVPEDLEAYTQLCIRIDNRQFTRRMEKGISTPSQVAMSGSPLLPGQTLPAGPTPMQLDTIQFHPKGQLTSEEKQRRMTQGLCLYCGLAGHLAKTCPKKTKFNHPNAKVQAH